MCPKSKGVIWTCFAHVVPTSDGLQPNSDGLHLVAMAFQIKTEENRHVFKGVIDPLMTHAPVPTSGDCSWKHFWG